jgi:8-oxo-dGTP diphosphatase
MGSNAFEAGIRKVIPAVLVYVTCGDEVLMLQRGGRPEDFHSGKWNGLGGKLDPDESPLEAAVRETREESGLALSPVSFRARGFVQFPNFKPQKSEDWWVSVFTVELSRKPAQLRAGDEGSLHWVARARVLELPLWPGDREFLPRVLAGEMVQGTVWYRDGAVARSWWA